jgi:hypothetical protein
LVVYPHHFFDFEFSLYRTAVVPPTPKGVGAADFPYLMILTLIISARCIAVLTRPLCQVVGGWAFQTKAVLVLVSLFFSFSFLFLFLVSPLESETSGRPLENLTLEDMRILR